MTQIHPTAIVDPSAQIGPDCQIGPYSVIGPDVEIGAGNRIGSHVVIEGRTKLGDRNVLFQFASIGSMPQDLKYHGEKSRLEIGSDNIIREYVTLQPGTEGGGMLTRIGDGNLFMASSHVGHDAQLGNNNVLANCASLAGHVVVGNRCVLGGLIAIHQFVRIGDFVLLGGGTIVAQDIPPFCMAQGDRAKIIGLNQIGLTRAGIGVDQIKILRKIYRQVLLGNGLLKDRLAKAQKDSTDLDLAQKFIDFIHKTERGIAGVRKGKGQSDD